MESLDHEEVLGVNIWVLWKIVILSADSHTLTEEVLVDLSMCTLVCVRRGDTGSWSRISGSIWLPVQREISQVLNAPSFRSWDEPIGKLARSAKGCEVVKMRMGRGVFRRSVKIMI